MPSPETTLAGRELALLHAAEDVLTRWALVRYTGGKMGSCGLPEAFAALDRACDAYPEIEPENDNAQA